MKLVRITAPIIENLYQEDVTMKTLCILTCATIVYGMFDYRGLVASVVLLGIQTVILLGKSIKDMVS